MLPAYFTRHATVWCSDFPPATPANAGLTSDHLPSAGKIAQKQKSGSKETTNQERRRRLCASALECGGLTPLWIGEQQFPFFVQNGGDTVTRKIVIIASAMISLASIEP